MEGTTPQSPETPKFKSPEEELAYLRQRVAEQERAVEHVPSSHEREEMAERAVAEYRQKPPEEVLDASYQMSSHEAEGITLNLSPEEHDAQMEEFLGLLEEKGIKNTIAILEQQGSPHLVDDFHRFLVQYVKASAEVPGLKKGSQTFRALHTRLYEVLLPEAEEDTGRTFKDLIAAMEQFYAGMMAIGGGESNTSGTHHFAIEIAVSNDTPGITFYAAVPEEHAGLFEKQITAVFPEVKLSQTPDDYNVFNDAGASVGAYGSFSGSPALPIRAYDQFSVDPVNVLLSVFSKLKEEGEGAAIQLVIAPAGPYFIKKYGAVLESMRKGVPLKKAMAGDSIAAGFGKAMGELVFGTQKPKTDDAGMPRVDQVKVEKVTEKIGATIANTNIRVIASAGHQMRADEILSDLESAFEQFSDPQGNSIRFKPLKGKELLKVFREFSYRVFAPDESLPLNLKELTTIVHFPVSETSAPDLKQAKAGTAPVPIDMEKSGVLLGVNHYRGTDTRVFMAPEDRLRHFYVIGQTGTGKTTIFKNMIVQDIQNGEGVCMIDPHGSDINDILANVPEERMGDVIYFDPASTSFPMGLNMLEYDPAYPEQKTFVINELLSIFNKLFDMSVAGGPMFEQYFRNATMLVMEDPATGNTLFEVVRVLADARFRALKLSRSKNPMVVQFWQEIAGKAGGEASLQNIVPYITNKFDVFLSNDIMRPIVGQERSAFHFRKVMDERKILLINLSKGRLGDINANLLGLIIVGKILMAALSRVDLPPGQKPTPFYLYIDEFQNITTDSISQILSEARKYGLSLNIAHQFIAQLQDSIRNAVFGNVGSMAAFRVGTDDAEFLEKSFVPTFAARDIANLDNYNAYMRMLVRGEPKKPFNIATLPPPKGDPTRAERIKELSSHTYGRPRAEVEEEIMAKYRKEPPLSPAAPRPLRAQTPPPGPPAPTAPTPPRPPEPPRATPPPLDEESAMPRQSSEPQIPASPVRPPSTPPAPPYTSPDSARAHTPQDTQPPVG